MQIANNRPVDSRVKCAINQIFENEIYFETKNSTSPDVGEFFFEGTLGHPIGLQLGIISYACHYSNP
jgi:hypothetical protein